MTRPIQISVCGSAAAQAETAELAREVGRRLAEAGATVVCGGLEGVMAAVAEGAATAGGDVIGVVPGEDPHAADPHATHVVATGVGTARNLAVAASGDALIAIGGAWGTLSEIAFARRLGRTVVALRSWSLAPPEDEPPGLTVAATPEEAVTMALSAARRELLDRAVDDQPRYSDAIDRLGR